MNFFKSTLFLVAMMALTAGAAPKLPKGLKWLTNDTDPVYASPNAKKGGTFRMVMLSFPLTLRFVGPDSNTAFRSEILNNVYSGTTFHPNTENVIPLLAEKWAYGKDNKSVFFKINKNAKWSDGKPVTAHDFAFTLDFMRSKNLRAPWYNTYYTEKFDKVVVYDDHTYGVFGKDRKSKTELMNTIDLPALPKHFFGGKVGKDFVKKYNWKIMPNVGPYQISKIKKGKFIEFSRKKDWWGKDLRYFKNRFNVDKVRYKLVRDFNIAYEMFRKGQLDTFEMIQPNFWYDKGKGKNYDKGYIKKLWFYVDAPQPDIGVWLNQAVPLFKDKNVRLGVLHSFNIQKVIDKVLRGDYMRAETNTMGYGAYTNKKLKARRFDLKKADKYFTKAGFAKRGPDGIRVNKDGQRLSFRVTYGAPHHTERLTVLKEEAKKAGLELTLQLLDGNASFKTMLEKKHEIAWSGWGAMFRPQYYGQYHSDNANRPQTNNFSNTSNKKLDKLIEAYRKGFDDKERAKLAHKIQQVVYDEAAYTPTFMVPYVRAAYWRYIKLPEVQATKTSELVFDRTYQAGYLFWIDEEEKKALKKAKKAGKAFPPEAATVKKFMML